jgi:hypothetical protein
MEFQRASTVTQEDARPFLERLSAGFEITWFRETGSRLWVALAKPSKKVEDHFGLHLECFVIGHGYPKDFHQRTLLQQPPSEVGYRVDPGVRFVASTSPQADSSCAAWAATHRIRIVLLRRDEGDDEEALYRLLSTYLWRRDLFAESEPVRLASEFFGREVAVNEVVARVLGGQPMGIFGLRKVGKSSLLARVTDLLAEDASFLVVPSVIIGNSAKIRSGRWSDVASELVTGWARALERIAERNALPIRPKATKTRDALARRQTDANVASAFEKDVLSLLSTARALATRLECSEVRLLAVVDECDHLYPHLATSEHWRTDFFTLWNTIQAVKRALDEPSTLTYLLGGVNPSGVERGALMEQANPLFETQKLYLKPMNRDEAGALLRGIGGRMGLKFSDEAVDAAFTQVGGHPMLLRKLGSAIHGDENRRAATVTVDERKVQNVFRKHKRAFYDYVLWVLEHLRQVAPDEERFLRDIAEEKESSSDAAWADDEYREVFAHHLEQYGLITFEGDVPVLGLALVREALKRPPASEFPEQKRSLKDLVDSLETAVRHRIVVDIRATRSLAEVIDAVVNAIPGDSKNRAVSRDVLREIGEVSGVDALVQSLNWGDYELVMRKFYDEIVWHGPVLEKTARLEQLKRIFTEAHVVRHNNDAELRKLISTDGYEVVAGRWRGCVDALTG